MADPRGFLKNRERVERPTRPVPVRIMDFKDVYVRQDEAIVRTQAGRCMDCGIPFCHSGCPLGNLIPEWNNFAWQGRWPEAIERLHNVTWNFLGERPEDADAGPFRSPAPGDRLTAAELAAELDEDTRTD